jgi:glycosyltransferase involved in cell wall biosynthesis
MINFSIIIPTYNRPHLIKRAIDSALLNIIDGDEILVIDDGSSESYSEILSDYMDKNVEYYRIPKGGVSAARNYGLSIAKHDHIAFLDDDDEWYEGHLLRHRSVYQYDDTIVGVFCNFNNKPDLEFATLIGVSSWSQGKPQIQDLLSRISVNGMPVYLGDHYMNQLKTDYILPSSFSYNRSICGKDKNFEVGLKRNQTWLFNSSICRCGVVAYIDEITCAQHGDAEHRATQISQFDTILSRLFVMGKEWGSNEEFLKHHREVYRKIQYEDFFHAFKTCVRYLSAMRFVRLIKLVGFFTAIPYIAKASFYIMINKKVETRTT